jgi:hypothetical protein
MERGRRWVPRCCERSRARNRAANRCDGMAPPGVTLTSFLGRVDRSSETIGPEASKSYGHFRDCRRPISGQLLSEIIARCAGPDGALDAGVGDPRSSAKSPSLLG